MKLKGIWNEKTSALSYAADEPGISYYISYLQVMSLELKKYIELEQASKPISGNGENPHTLWSVKETKFLEIMGKPNSPDDLKLGGYDDEMNGSNVIWQSTEDGADVSSVTIILIGYDLF